MCTKSTIHGSLHKVPYKGIYISFTHNWVSLVTQMVKQQQQQQKKPTCNAGDPDLIPGLGRSPGEGNGYPLQYSCLKSPIDRGAWWTTMHGIAKSLTWLRNEAHTSAYSKFPKIGNSPDALKLVDIWRKCDIWYKWILLISRKKFVYLAVHGILQARILEWVAIPFSRGSSQFRDQPWVSCIAGRLYCLSHQGSPGVNINLILHQH